MTVGLTYLPIYSVVAMLKLGEMTLDTATRMLPTRTTGGRAHVEEICSFGNNGFCTHQFSYRS